MGSDGSDDETTEKPPTTLAYSSHEEKKDEKKEDLSASDDLEFTYRIYCIFSYFIVLVVIGIPIWWYTTRVYRAPLPLDLMSKYELPNKTSKQFGIPLSLSYDILVTIVNPDPSNLKLDLDGEEFRDGLSPFVDKFRNIIYFRVKSQWLYLVELGAAPRKVLDHYALDEDQLPHVITPLEKKLSSQVSLRPCLNLVLYVSHCDVPLFIYSKENEKSETNAFVSPRWGGIYIINPDAKSCKAREFRPNVQTITSVFANQLMKMLEMEQFDEQARSKFRRRKAEEFIISTKRTLKSLAQLLSEINSIVISDEVAFLVHRSVSSLRRAEHYLDIKAPIEALGAAKEAFADAERAFTNPSLLALLYFPDDQKYAVYIPLFLPVMIPVLMSLSTARNLYNRRKNTKVKTD